MDTQEEYERERERVDLMRERVELMSSLGRCKRGTTDGGEGVCGGREREWS